MLESSLRPPLLASVALLVTAALCATTYSVPAAPSRTQDPQLNCPKPCAAMPQEDHSGTPPAPPVEFVLTPVYPAIDGKGTIECATCPNESCKWGIAAYSFNDPNGTYTLTVMRPGGPPESLGSHVPLRSGRLKTECNAAPDFIDCQVFQGSTFVCSKTMILDCGCVF